MRILVVLGLKRLAELLVADLALLVHIVTLEEQTELFFGHCEPKSIKPIS